MDTFLNRAQRGYGKLTFVITFAAVLVAASGLLELYLSGAFRLPATIMYVTPKMRWFDSRAFGGAQGRPKENARFTFDLSTDLGPLFTWNTKQVYVYVTIDYDSLGAKGQDVANSVVIWDRIVTSRDAANLTLKNVPSKYSAWDVHNAFGALNREVTLNLRWNVQPKLGFLTFGRTEKTVDFVVRLPKGNGARKSKAAEKTKANRVERVTKVAAEKRAAGGEPVETATGATTPEAAPEAAPAEATAEPAEPHHAAGQDPVAGPDAGTDAGPDAGADEQVQP